MNDRERWEEIRENSWIEVESGDQAFRQDRQVDLLCKRNAEMEDKLSDALSGLEYIRMRYGALDGVGWNRLGLLDGEPASTEEQP